MTKILPIILAARIIEENMLDCPTNQEIARLVCLDQYSLKKGFKKKFGCGMYQYSIRLRMNIAKELLSSTEEPIKNIWKKVGYKSIASFITAFKKHEKITPVKYRKKIIAKRIEKLKVYSHSQLEKMLGHEFEYRYL